MGEQRQLHGAHRLADQLVRVQGAGVQLLSGFPLRLGRNHPARALWFGRGTGKKIVIDAAVELLADYTANSRTEWKEVVGKYFIEDAVIEPTLALTLTDNWIQFNLRYIVDYKKRRMTKHRLHEKINQGVEASEGMVKLASATFEVVKMPDIKIDLRGKKE